MSYRPHGRATVDPSSPRAWGVCDRCGGWVVHATMQWQSDYRGVMIRTGALVCSRCLDDPQPQQRNIVLPADPPSVRNARTEPFALDEVGNMFTGDALRLMATDIVVQPVDAVSATAAVTATAGIVSVAVFT